MSEAYNSYQEPAPLSRVMSDYALALERFQLAREAYWDSPSAALEAEFVAARVALESTPEQLELPIT